MSQTVRVLQRAYGLDFSGLPRVDELEPSTDAGGPAVDVSSQPSGHPPAERLLDDEGGVRRLSDGRVLSLDRHRARAVFHGPPLTADLLAHPYLGPVATAFSRWQGRESFHAGAFVGGGRAWAVSGPRTAGKSTLLAALAAHGTPVLTDDILVTDGSEAYAGPRCVDLREAPPFAGLDLRRARDGARLRVRLPSTPPSVALGGWIFLSWGPDLLLERVPPKALLGALSARRAARQLRSDPAVLLALTTLPAWRLVRPRRFDAVPDTLALLDETVARVVTTGPVPPVRR